MAEKKSGYFMPTLLTIAGIIGGGLFGKYVEGISMNSILHFIFIELWFIWFGVGVGLLAWFIQTMWRFNKSAVAALNYDEKLNKLNKIYSDIDQERREIMSHVNNFYNGIMNKLEKLEKKIGESR